MTQTEQNDAEKQPIWMLWLMRGRPTSPGRSVSASQRLSVSASQRLSVEDGAQVSPGVSSLRWLLAFISITSTSHMMKKEKIAKEHTLQHSKA